MATSPKTTRRLKVARPTAIDNRPARPAVVEAKQLDPAAQQQIEQDAALWRRYVDEGSQELRDALIERYFPLVRIIAERMAARLPASVQAEDLCGAGVFGLINAIEGFDPDYGVKFETYCTTRIRGAMLDEMRQLDWAPRQVRSMQSRYDTAVAQLESQLGRMPSDTELMEHLELGADEFEEFARKAAAAQITSLTQTVDEENGALSRLSVMANANAPEPGESVASTELFPTLGEMLTPVERVILVLYYHESMTMKEIGRIHGISESRVCQIHGKVIERLRTQFGF